MPAILNAAASHIGGFDAPWGGVPAAPRKSTGMVSALDQYVAAGGSGRPRGMPSSFIGGFAPTSQDDFLAAPRIQLKGKVQTAFPDSGGSSSTEHDHGKDTTSGQQQNGTKEGGHEVKKEPEGQHTGS
mmetsp:Transcript_9567/g.21913  ORF Transcript_9567/g.21913 Transcript_9567/m.21913 type:complete len:128 (+) Transcript_9567:70-453(+)